MSRRSKLGRTRSGGGRPPTYEERLRNLGAQVDGRSRAPRREKSDSTARRRGIRRRSGKPRWSRKRKALTSVGVILLLVVAATGAGYGYLSYRLGQLPKIDVSALRPATGGSFNMLVIGSDSRVGLTPAEQQQAGSAAQVSGQRSDVVMIWHVDPGTHQISILSIPRDTLVQMDADQSTLGRFNRINSSYNEGANLLIETIENNFGIPINHVMEVDFGGFEGAVNALGGVWMNFPYPAKDAYSGLDITHTGCQLLNGTQALAVARSRHYQYEVNGQWLYDGTSDFGRIDRQDSFLRALLAAAKSKVNPLTLNAFFGSLSQGIVIDNDFSAIEFLRLFVSFHSLPASALNTYTLPTISNGYVSPWGDVLFVDQPSAQQMLTSIFGTALTAPSTPPPDTALVPSPPPSLSATLYIPSGKGAALLSNVLLSSAVTPNTPPSFDPKPCSP